MHVEKNFVDIENMICDAIEIDCENIVSFIAKYDDAVIILKELLKYDGFNPFCIDLSDPSFDGYDKEFIVSFGADGDVFCEKYCRKDGYIIPNDGVTFILPGCSDECVSHLYKYRDGLFINVEFEDETESCGCYKWGDDVSFVASCDDAFADNCCVTPCRDGNGFFTGYITIGI